MTRYGDLSTVWILTSLSILCGTSSCFYSTWGFSHAAENVPSDRLSWWPERIRNSAASSVRKIRGRTVISLAAVICPSVHQGWLCLGVHLLSEGERTDSGRRPLATHYPFLVLLCESVILHPGYTHSPNSEGPHKPWGHSEIQTGMSPALVERSDQCRNRPAVWRDERHYDCYNHGPPPIVVIKETVVTK